MRIKTGTILLIGVMVGGVYLYLRAKKSAPAGSTAQNLLNGPMTSITPAQSIGSPGLVYTPVSGTLQNLIAPGTETANDFLQAAHNFLYPNIGP